MKNTRLYFIMLFFGVLFLVGCEYSFVQQTEITPPTPDPDNPISFAAEIVPIFTSRCLDCHGVGATSPDLTAANAYASITAMSLVNTTDPASSELYNLIAPPAVDHGWRYYTASQASLVLLWIQEGALNN